MGGCEIYIPYQQACIKGWERKSTLGNKWSGGGLLLCVTAFFFYLDIPWEGWMGGVWGLLICREALTETHPSGILDVYSCWELDHHRVARR
jgi:hypothetical protein